MPPLRRLVLGLNAATVVLVAAGILVLVVPSPVPAGRTIAGTVASSSATPDSVRPPLPADLGAADRVVRTDIFSPRRSAPPQRYVFGETAQEPDVTSAEMTVAPALAGEALDSTAASTTSDAVPYLYGTMLGPTDATALLRLDARASEPRLYRVGDTAGGYRVAEIADRSVTLMGRNGRVVLRLARPDQ
jgi:hypothetical protein